MKTLWLVVTAAVAASVAQAGNPGDPSKRSGTWEGGFIVSQVDNWDVSGRGGSRVDVESDTGWGFLLGYNFNEKMNLSFEFTHNEQSYDADIVDASSPGNVVSIDHRLTNDFYNFNFTYNLLASAFTPFVSAGLGWNYMDSNLSNGDSSLVCWWDPWWGYVCNNYYDTYSDTAFSYSIGGGLRWDITRGFSMKASINQRWIDLDKVKDEPELLYGKLEFVWRL